ERGEHPGAVGAGEDGDRGPGVRADRHGLAAAWSTVGLVVGVDRARAVTARERHGAAPGTQGVGAGRPRHGLQLAVGVAEESAAVGILRAPGVGAAEELDLE